MITDYSNQSSLSSLEMIGGAGTSEQRESQYNFDLTESSISSSIDPSTKASIIKPPKSVGAS